MFSITVGFGKAEYKCTSGLNYNCYNYVEETMNIIPLTIEYDYILRKKTAFGIILNDFFSERESIPGIMFTLKFGYIGQSSTKTRS